MRFRNYKSFSLKSIQSVPNIISECVVDYFIDSKSLHPYNINTSIFGKSCNIYLPTTNLIGLRDYLFTEKYDLFDSFSEINFFTQNTPFYSDTMNYGNYYGYAIRNEYNSIPVGKYLSTLIVESLTDNHSHMCQLTFDTKKNIIVSLTLVTTDKLITEELVSSIVPEYISEITTISIIPSINVKDEFHTNTNLHNYYELPQSNNNFIGSDPNSPNRILPLYLRYISKNLVNSGLMDECLISVNYTQNLSAPVSLFIDSFGTENYSMKDIYNCVLDVFPLSLKQIKEKMDFYKPIYRQTYENNYLNLTESPWEQLDKTSELIIF